MKQYTEEAETKPLSCWLDYDKIISAGNTKPRRKGRPPSEVRQSKEERNAVKLAWAKENEVMIKAKLIRGKDDDLIAWVKSKGNVSAYIRDLVRADMNKAESN